VKTIDGIKNRDMMRKPFIRLDQHQVANCAES
jgi:hypothetical protein